MTRLDTSSSRLRLALLTSGGALVVGGIVAAQTPTAPADEAVRRAVVVYEAALKGFPAWRFIMAALWLEEFGITNA